MLNQFKIDLPADNVLPGEVNPNIMKRLRDLFFKVRCRWAIVSWGV